MPRYRYDQLMALQWRTFLPVSLALFILVILLIAVFTNTYLIITVELYIIVHAIIILTRLFTLHEWIIPHRILNEFMNTVSRLKIITNYDLKIFRTLFDNLYIILKKK